MASRGTRKTSSEMRRFNRVPACDADACVCLKGSPVESRCLNIGLGGMALAVNESLHHGETYAVEMVRPPFKNIQARAQVVWSSKEATDSWSQVGLRFLQLDQHSLNSLCNYREYLHKQEPN